MHQRCCATVGGQHCPTDPFKFKELPAAACVICAVFVLVFCHVCLGPVCFCSVWSKPLLPLVSGPAAEGVGCWSMLLSDLLVALFEEGMMQACSHKLNRSASCSADSLICYGSQQQQNSGLNRQFTTLHRCPVQFNMK